MDLQQSSAPENVDASGRVDYRDRYCRQQVSDPGSKRLDRAGTGEVEENPILGLFDLHGYFKEDEHHRRGLGLGQRGVL